MNMRDIPPTLVILTSGLIIAGVLVILVLTGYISIEEIYTRFIVFVFSLVIISILAIIGAVFIGMFISHRVFSSRQFTTFEEEMLKMKSDVNEMKEMIQELKEED
ncbi:MAG: hypothetical protein ACOC40_00170 [Thermoplasmatota archaeon]